MINWITQSSSSIENKLEKLDQVKKKIYCKALETFQGSEELWAKKETQRGEPGIWGHVFPRDII